MPKFSDTMEFENITGDQLREHTLQMARKFKTSWVDLARAIYTVYKDKAYKQWGYDKFDTYVVKEIGIRKMTALKLLRSYSFLEREEPIYLKPEYSESGETAKIPSYETIDVLRKAKNNKELGGRDYMNLREQVFLKGKDAGEVRRDLTTLMKQREELTPEEAWVKKKEVNIKRCLSTLKSLKRELEDTKMVSQKTLKEMKDLIDKLEIELQ